MTVLNPPASRTQAVRARSGRAQAAPTSRRGLLDRFRDLPTARKLLVGYLVLVAMMAVVGAIGLQQLSASENRIESLYTDSYEASLNLAAINVDEANVSAVLEEAMLDGMTPELKAEMDKLATDVNANWDAYLATDTTGREKVIAQFEKSLAAFRSVRDDTVLPLLADGKLGQANTAKHEQLDPAAQQLTDDLGTVIDTEKAISKDLITASKSAYANARVLIIGLVLVAGALGIALAVFLGRLVARPLQRTVEVLELVAAGRLDQSLEVDSADEIGRMSTALNGALGKLASAMGQMDANARSLASASEELSSVSGQMSGSASESSSQAGLVSAAAEQVSRNVQTVATGTEEMSASIREIAQNASNAAGVAAQAVVVAESTNATVAKLGDSSAEVGNVIKVINSIAEQTNLLALNATIEAARAGEAGKGFAVVANEVKELAQETGKATEDIGRRIEAIQSDTEAAVAAIAEIAEIIGQINDTQATIASAVEEQTATTNEMSRNVAEAATGSSDIAVNVTGVARSASDTQAAANSTSQAADELARMAAEMRTLVGQFQY
ncbi:methyl-accepting chemotaxis protein [Nocardioides okcheonensis]|uniref:methyl-accepting chemotaxis protein n=1 Tax=Nocardioides okcheonensis TaxID=2894081 RepID=UPI001E5C49D8|nr:methyl-accepting chemotaxis protein [Nocardioides okcheonensis]UFN43029.1 methyl-accepting chemotaxis protein [Nocardioides okcheonensis]